MISQTRIVLAFTMLLAVPAALGVLALRAADGPAGPLVSALLLLHALLAAGLVLAARAGGRAGRLAKGMGPGAQSLPAALGAGHQASAWHPPVPQARAQRLEAMLHSFGDDTREMLEGFRQAARRLDDTALQITQAAEASQRGAGVLATASAGASGHAGTAMAAAGELAAAMGAITCQAGRSAEAARGATAQIEQAARSVSALAETTGRIGDIGRLVADIARQAERLSLQAGTGAAHGDVAGPGLAAGARSLASQTARAIGEIGQQLDAIQGATGLAVEALRSIGMVVVEIDQASVAIVEAVQQQGRATREIAHSIAGTAEAAGLVARETGAVRGASVSNDEMAREVRAASAELHDRADTLRAQMERFLSSLRTA